MGGRLDFIWQCKDKGYAWTPVALRLYQERYYQRLGRGFDGAKTAWDVVLCGPIKHCLQEFLEGHPRMIAHGKLDARNNITRTRLGHHLCVSLFAPWASTIYGNKVWDATMNYPVPN